MDSTTEFEFLESLSRFVKNFLRASVLIDGVVTNVNDNFTCDIEVQQVAYTGVPVKVLTGSQASIYEVPVIGTTCLVRWRDNHRQLPQIDSFDQVDHYYISVNDFDINVKNTFKISANLTQFNGGNNGGLPMSPDVTERLNLIENQQNEILDILKAIIVPTTTPYPFAPLFAGVNDLIPTEESDIANPDITQ